MQVAYPLKGSHLRVNQSTFNIFLDDNFFTAILGPKWPHLLDLMNPNLLRYDVLHSKMSSVYLVWYLIFWPPKILQMQGEAPKISLEQKYFAWPSQMVPSTLCFISNKSSLLTLHNTQTTSIYPHNTWRAEKTSPYMLMNIYWKIWKKKHWGDTQIFGCIFLCVQWLGRRRKCVGLLRAERSQRFFYFLVLHEFSMLCYGLLQFTCQSLFTADSLS